MKNVSFVFWTVLFCLLGQGLFAQEIPPKEKTSNPLKEETSETLHSITLDGKELHYRAIAGNLLLKNEQQNPKASMFYVAYFKEDVPHPSERPLIFCFNGGPGSSSVWLHMGAFGPQRIAFNQKNKNIAPYETVENEYSLLDLADLVFIDPVSTGYSCVAPGESTKQYFGVDEDIKAVADFIRQFITLYERWDSPKLLAGESYGTTRAAGLAEYLHTKLNVYLNGIIMISSVLNFQTLHDFDKGNDLPYPLVLPTYTATAWYHKKLNQDLQRDFHKTIEEAKHFALTDYTVALMQGDKLAEDERAQIVQKLALFTGLSPAFIEKSNLRINPFRFAMELLRDKNLTLGRFDSTIVGDSLDTSCDFPGYDPSYDAVAGIFTAAFNQYARQDLKVKNDLEYKILEDTVNANWNYSKATNQFLNMALKLHDVMVKNKNLKVFVANGYYDLRTPFFATDYTYSHMRLPKNLQDHISLYYYDSGHMMYLQQESLAKLKQDLTHWLTSSLRNLNNPSNLLKD